MTWWEAVPQSSVALLGAADKAGCLLLLSYAGLEMMATTTQGASYAVELRCLSVSSFYIWVWGRVSVRWDENWPTGVGDGLDLGLAGFGRWVCG